MHRILMLSLVLILFIVTRLIYRKRNYDIGEVVADIPNLSRVEIDKTLEKYEKRNGNRLKDFSIKEIVLMFHKDTKIDLEKSHKDTIITNKKLDKHIEWAEKNMAMGNKFIRDHDIMIQKITDNLSHIASELPAKGFCEKVTNELELDKEQTVNDKVELMWHDRRWIKAILAALLAVGGGNIVIQIFL